MAALAKKTMPNTDERKIYTMITKTKTLLNHAKTNMQLEQ
jgi:hypothetical protein